MLVNENLVINSYLNINSNAYVTSFIYLKEPLVDGETYTISIYGDFKDSETIRLYHEKGYGQIAKINNDRKCITSTFIYKKYTDPDNVENYRKLALYKFPAENTDNIFIEKVKIEKGEELTPYCPHKDDLSIETKPFYIGGNYTEEQNQTLIEMLDIPLENYQPKGNYLTATDIANLASKTELNNYVEKVDGKGLSTNDFTDEQKTKVDNIPDNPKYTDTQYSVGDGLKVADNEISVDSAKVMTMDSWNTSIGPSFGSMINDAMLKNQKDQMPLTIWVGTQQEYDAIVHLNDTTLYFIKE